MKAILMYPCGTTRQDRPFVNLISDLFRRRQEHPLVWIRGEEIVVFLFGNRARDFQELESSIQRARRVLTTNDQDTVYCGTSSFHTVPMDLRAAYGEAVSCIERFSPTENVGRYKQNTAFCTGVYQAQQSVVYALLLRKAPQAREAVRRWLAMEGAQGRVFYLAYSLVATVYEIVGTEDAIDGRCAEIFDQLQRNGESRHNHEHTFATLIETLIEQLGGVGRYRNIPLVHDAIRYTRDHFTERVTVQRIADTLGVSPSHLSKCFNQVTQTSFSRFLLSIRMREAARLLRDGKLSVAEAGTKIGLEDPCYFSKSFRRYYQMTPSEFITINRVITPHP